MILNYKALHNGYEGMVDDHWNMFYTDNKDRNTIYNPNHYLQDYMELLHG